MADQELTVAEQWVHEVFQVDPKTNPVIERLQRALQRNRDEGLPIKYGLGMQGSFWPAYSRKERDYWLRQAARLINPETKNKVAELSTKIKIFESMYWQPHKNFDRLPDDYADVYQYLFKAAKTSCPLPEDRQLRRIILGFVEDD